MNKKQKIIQKYLKGDSKRSIANITNISRNTVRKYIEEFENSKQQDIRRLPIPENIMSEPSYKPRISPKRA
ncbi:Homeodomain-like domain-containing protein [Gracilibacillus ureilyticus]|uniref:Homeodomain-like domain-containing protein n=1 Tax=Gracilibacillus ureilyticus TaxID=531814 RepID=A0A1H9VZU3_9BACI|nr:helix-turn-helix domain-containing protein [Gracilibacillus ureilyticus]SES27162.1 Homeodomain-like domain-containing protein [Gracilibacillus ureilyticus]